MSPRSHALLAGLFDYAGLFAPASLPLDEALANYARYRVGRHGWMLGRFVVSIDRLDAVSLALRRLAPALGAALGERALPGDHALPWRITALLDAGAEGGAAEVEAFNRRHASPEHGLAVVDTIEVKAPTIDLVRGVRGWASRGFEVYCEVPLGQEMEHVLDAVARAGLHAKVRTGGVTPESIPAFDAVAAFLCGCVARGVVAKATAGLHHVVTGDHPLWPSAAATRARMLGFLNLVLGAGIVEGVGRAAAQSPDVCATVARLLAVAVPPTWAGHRQVDWGGAGGPIIEGPLDQFALSGRALIRSIGTCSFEEPVEDARRVGLLS